MNENPKTPLTAFSDDEQGLNRIKEVFGLDPVEFPTARQSHQ